MNLFNINKKSTSIQNHKTVGIFIPTYGRPHELSRVVDNIIENTPFESFTIYFILEESDQASFDVAKNLKAEIIINKGKPCYADAINTAYHKTNEPYFFTGADDLGFYRGWLEEAMKLMIDPIKVVGTNDLGSIPIGVERDATHYLVARDYIKKQSGVIDQPNTVLFSYLHNWTDKEFLETARSRGVYSYSEESKVEHAHPVWNKAQWDETYRKGQRTSEQDRHTYLSRQSLWQK